MDPTAGSTVADVLASNTEILIQSWETSNWIMVAACLLAFLARGLTAILPLLRTLKRVPGVVFNLAVFAIPLVTQLAVSLAQGHSTPRLIVNAVEVAVIYGMGHALAAFAQWSRQKELEDRPSDPPLN